MSASTQKNVQKNTGNIFKKISMSEQFFCMEHPNKKAKYYLKEQNNVYFCSKCALKFASQGKQVIEKEDNGQFCNENLDKDIKLQSINKQNSSKGDSIREFLLGLDKNIQEIKGTNFILNLQLNDLKDHYTLQIENLLFTFDQIEQIIQDEKNRLLIEINNYFNSTLEEMEENVKNMIKNETVLINFEKEINLNSDEIIQEMDSEIFYTILGDYQNKMLEIQQSSKNFQNNKIEKYFIINNSLDLYQSVLQIIPSIQKNQNEKQLSDQVTLQQQQQSSQKNIYNNDKIVNILNENEQQNQKITEKNSHQQQQAKLIITELNSHKKQAKSMNEPNSLKKQVKTITELNSHKKLNYHRIERKKDKENINNKNNNSSLMRSNSLGSKSLKSLTPTQSNQAAQQYQLFKNRSNFKKNPEYSQQINPFHNQTTHSSNGKKNNGQIYMNILKNFRK